MTLPIHPSNGRAPIPKKIDFTIRQRDCLMTAILLKRFARFETPMLSSVPMVRL